MFSKKESPKSFILPFLTTVIYTFYGTVIYTDEHSVVEWLEHWTCNITGMSAAYLFDNEGLVPDTGLV